MDPSDVAGVVLAAGAGKRFGGFKPLARLRGQTLLGHAVQALREAGCWHVLVITNPGWPAIPTGAGDAELLDNPDWAEGMGSSLRRALRDATVTQVPAAVLMLADTPSITAACVSRVIAAAPGPSALVQASYRGRRGHPVLLGREHYAGVAELAVGDVGARPYLAANATALTLVECADIGSAEDVDTVEDLRRLGG